MSSCQLHQAYYGVEGQLPCPQVAVLTRILCEECNTYAQVKLTMVMKTDYISLS